MRLLVFIFLGALLMGAPVQARLLITQSEAVAQIFPQAHIIPRNQFLDETQLALLEKIAKAKFDTKLITYYEIQKDGKLRGYVFIDQHRVRTMPETVLVALDTQGKLLKIKILVFNEPLDYVPSARWLSLFEGKRLNEQLWMKQDLDAISGSTLSSWAVLRAVRRSMALHQVIIMNR